MKRTYAPLLASVVAAGLFPVLGIHAAARPHGGPPAATTSSITVLVGQGQAAVSPGSALIFTPRYVDITAGDTVVFRDVDTLEPHTVSFGPMAMLEQIANNPFRPVPQKNGPPQLVFDPRIAFPTPGHTYAGSGFANSGLLQNGQSWSLTFTRPGTYRYICLIHGAAMAGAVVVHAPQQGHMFTVLAGDSPTAFNDRANETTNDSFYPRHLTIHVGDTVQWIGGFHTVTFGPEAVRTQLEKNLLIPVPQKNGPPQLALNPKIANPSGGSTYDGTGFVNSGLLFMRVPPGSKAPPTYRLTFTRPGTYEYDCLIHPGMDGTITVAP